jgi:internalin A
VAERALVRSSLVSVAKLVDFERGQVSYADLTRINYRGLHTRYPQIAGFVKTDCKEGVGLDDVRKTIERVAVNMPEISMSFPLSWFRVKERLESAEDDYMSYDSFCRLCRTEGVMHEDDQLTLCWALHCLGIALNYRDDARLRETSVLKPKWLTQGVYRLLNAVELYEQQGELYLTDLQKILPANQYPNHTHLFLLEVSLVYVLRFLITPIYT